MNAVAEKKAVSRKTKGKRPARPAKERKDDSKDIERAVYDGMQDLRVKKFR